ncbi:MAG: hypothetical protein WKF93_08645, partial [Acidimicrobiales bacterium]
TLVGPPPTLALSPPGADLDVLTGQPVGAGLLETDPQIAELPVGIDVEPADVLAIDPADLGLDVEPADVLAIDPVELGAALDRPAVPAIPTVPTVPAAPVLPAVGH